MICKSNIDTVQQFNELYGCETLHPLVSVVRYDKPTEIQEHIVQYGIYALFLKENNGCKLSYGRTKYDFDEMTVTSFAPGQTIHIQPMPKMCVGCEPNVIQTIEFHYKLFFSHNLISLN